jgi:pimeloyl-ACP methyl ester carboxylesterase
MGWQEAQNHSYVDARPSGVPRSDRCLTLRDGRRVQCAEWGPADGLPLIFMHGRPGSRLLCPDVPATEDAGVRFIAFDRPGYGRSDPRTDVPSYLAASADVEEMLDQLELDRVAVIGWSGGGPYALACAALLPGRVSSVTTICSPSAPENGTSDDPGVTAIEDAVRRDPVASRDLVRARAAVVLGDRTWIVRTTEQEDPAVFDAPQMRILLQELCDEATAITPEGYVDDWIVSTLDWPFELSDVTAPSYVWFGERDDLVAPSHAHALTAGLPGGRSIGCADCGHFVPIAHWPQILRHATAV